MSNGNQPPSLIQPSRMAPHSVEAEEAVLGALLINPELLYDVADFLNPDDFFIVRNAWAFEAIIRLHQRHEAIDYLTVTEELKSQARLEEMGGAAYVTYLVNHTPSGIYAVTYAHIVERAATRRRMLAAAAEIAQQAQDETIDTPTAIERGESAWIKVVDSSTSADDAESISDLSADDLDRVEQAIQNGTIQGVNTGFYDYDNLTGGLQPEEVTVLAGRPGSGKTSLALSIALHVSRYTPVAFFSLEMSKRQVTQRLKSALSGLSSLKIRNGRLDSETEWPAYVQATKDLQSRRLFVYDKPGLTPLQILTIGRRLVHQHGIGLIMIDYAQLMKPGVKRDSRELEVSYVSSAVKDVAKTLHLPVLLLAQMNRAVEAREDKTPRLSDLRESGALENDADLVVFIHRDEMYNPETERPNQADIIIGKHRNGPTGSFALYFRKELTQFDNMSKTDLDLGGF